MTHPIKALTSYYRKHNILPSSTIACMEYAMLSIYNEWIKIIIYCILFSFLGYAYQFWFVLAILYPLRWLSGGIHAKTFWGCFFSSLLVLALLIFVSPVLPCYPGFYTFLLFLFGIGSLTHIPYTPAFRPITNVRTIVILRCFYIGLLSMWLIILKTCSLPAEYVTIGYFTLFFQVLQLYIPKKGENSHA
ncbi:MAG: accessory gene regulator B family protein [Firmicutes bacterium]|nr:accessory gene regulator B family protein [Bacillota bacterium]